MKCERALEGDRMNGSQKGEDWECWVGKKKIKNFKWYVSKTFFSILIS